MVLFTDRLIISHSLKKKLRKVQQSMHAGGEWQVRFDSAFEQVMRACAAPRRDGAGTWISEEIIQGYSSLHESGYAHSVELWHGDQLVGGAYGVAIGRMFYGESMFAKETDASKIALAYLVTFLREQGVRMIDCQQETAHLASLGAFAIPRGEFIRRLTIAIEQAPIETWQVPALF